MGESVRELAAQRSLDKITVKEIAQNCGVTSATFYNHFKDKYDLIAWVLNEQMEQMNTPFSYSMIAVQMMNLCCFFIFKTCFML